MRGVNHEENYAAPVMVLAVLLAVSLGPVRAFAEQPTVRIKDITGSRACATTSWSA